MINMSGGGDISQIKHDFEEKMEKGFFSCSIDPEVASNGSVKYFEGTNCVITSIIGPQILVKKNEEAVLNFEARVRGDPSIDEQKSRYFEENIVSVVSSVVEKEFYPHHTIRFFVVVVQHDRNVRIRGLMKKLYSTIMNSVILCLLVNGVKLKKSCFCLDITKTKDGEYRLFEASPEEDSSISLTMDIINKKILHIISYDDITINELDLIRRLTDGLSDSCKMILKSFLNMNY